MKILIIGVGGVGQSVAMIIKRAGAEGQWAEKVVLSDYNLARAEAVAKLVDDPRFVPEKINAKDPASIKAVVEKHGITWIMNAVEPSFNPYIFDTALECGVGYLDCAMTLGEAHPEKPFELVNVKLGDAQFAQFDKWKEKGCLALVGSGVEPGMADVFAKFAEKYLFDEIDEVNVRDGDSYHFPEGVEGGAFGFSVWTTIEECLNPPVIYEKARKNEPGKGWFCTENFSEPEIFDFPGGIGPVEVINVEHEEVLLVPREIDCNRVTFKYGVPRELRQLLLNLREVGMDEAKKTIKVGDSEIAPRDFLVKVIPSPLDTAAQMLGKGCAGTWVTGKKDGLTRSVYLYQIADNQECVKKYGTNSVVAQTAVVPVIMMELVAKGIWKGAGVFGPESFDPDPVMERLAKYEFPAAMEEKNSEYATKLQQEALLKIMK
ncbi:MAG: saccharopine dehydrogenase NADP-binding domain-containing protein [Bacillota bacterium]|nr:saccharopine dehydrogenase NADP-binding domain-containing protein [Bacillota bacterium]